MMPQIMFKFKCDRCGQVISGRTEMEAEVKWGRHECPGRPSLDLLPMPILRDLALGRITEDEAWRQAAEQGVKPQ